MINWLSHRAGKGFIEGIIDAIRDWLNEVLKPKPEVASNRPTPWDELEREFNEFIKVKKRAHDVLLEQEFNEYLKVKDKAHDVLKGRR